MFTRWSDFDRTVAFMDELRRRMDRALEDFEPGLSERAFTPARLLGTTGWPRVNVADGGTNFVVMAEVPGLSEKDLTLNLTQDTLTLTGERKVTVPEGYSVHRQERTPVKFSRSVYFPTRVNPERSRASIKNGLLQIEIDKADEEKPRQITVKAS